MPSRLSDRVVSLVRLLDRMRDLALLFVRASVGGLFVLSGWAKLHRLDEFTAYFETLEIPAAAIQAPVVASLEFVGGMLLLVGLATRPVSVVLAGTMAVATVSARLREANVSSLAEFLYLNEWLLILILLVYVFVGPGKLAVDRWLAERYGLVAQAP